jgi:hypothetical protein
MKFNPLKTRFGKLTNGLTNLNLDNETQQHILSLIVQFEKDNLETIDKLKREKKVELNKINGGLKQAINSHGPITKELIGSASKRIYGSLLSNTNKKSLITRFIGFFKNLFK